MTIFLLDRSGSMEMRLEDTIGGFNAFVRQQIPLGGTLTLYTFSDDLRCEYEDLPIDKVPLLTKESYVPGGSTALFDSIGRILKKHTCQEKQLLVILTDGHENSSKKFTKAHVKDLISLSTFEIMYVGADIEEACEIGINNTLFYDGENTQEIFKSVSESVASTVLKLSKSQHS